MPPLNSSDPCLSTVEREPEGGHHDFFGGKFLSMFLVNTVSKVMKSRCMPFQIFLCMCILQTCIAKSSTFGTRHWLKYRAVYLQNSLTYNAKTFQKAFFSDEKLFKLIFWVCDFSEFADISSFDEKLLVFIAFKVIFQCSLTLRKNALFSVVS